MQVAQGKLFRGFASAVVAAAALVAAAVDAQAASVVIDLRGTDSIQPSFTGTTGGVSWQTTGQFELFAGSNIWVPLNVDRASNGMGVTLVGLQPQIDAPLGVLERLGINFTPTVRLDRLRFTLADLGGDGDEFYLFTPDGTRYGPTAIGGTGAVIFDLTALIPNGALRSGGQFYIGSTDGNDDFRISHVEVEFTAMPLPTAFWSGLGLLGGVAVVARMRRRRSAPL